MDLLFRHPSQTPQEALLLRVLLQMDVEVVVEGGDVPLLLAVRVAIQILLALRRSDRQMLDEEPRVHPKQLGGEVDRAVLLRKQVPAQKVRRLHPHAFRMR